MGEKKTLGKAIDEMVETLSALDESMRAIAVRTACEHLRVPAFLHEIGDSEEGSSGSGAAELKGSGQNATSASGSSQHTLRDIRSFKEDKHPTSDAEMACVVAYYLEALAPPTERKREISSADLDRYFRQANYPLPKRLPQLLVNAKAGGYFDSAGHGKYKLNPVGHNLVVHSLPKKAKT